MAKKIGILGGTFDPVHIGHLRSAIEVLEGCGLDEVRLIPGAVPPHRVTPNVSAQQRLTMVELAVQDISGLSADDRELQRTGPSWTIDTLLSIREELDPHDQLYFILGQDAFAGLDRWHRWQELLDHCHLLVLQRPDQPVPLPVAVQALLDRHGVDIPADIQQPHGRIGLIQQSPLAVSATAIRHQLAAGRMIRFLVPAAVEDYIHQQDLYAATSETQA